MKKLLLSLLLFTSLVSAQQTVDCDINPHHPHCNNIRDNNRCICKSCEELLGDTNNVSDEPYCNGQNTEPFIDNFSYNYIHKASDYTPGSGKDSCKPCGGGSFSNKLMDLDLKRYWRSRDTTESSSFGVDGHYWNYDINLTLYEVNGAYQIDYFNITKVGQVRYHIVGDVFKDTYYRDTQYLELLKADGSRTTTAVDAACARLVLFSGYVYTFEIFENDGIYSGRLKSYKDRNDYGIELTYYHNKDASVLSSQMKWMVSSVKDAFNRVMSVNYLPDTRQNRYVVSSITLPNNQVINYNYGSDPDDSLESISYPDGSTSTFSLGPDPDNASRVIRTFSDNAADRAFSRNKAVVLSTSAVLSQSQLNSVQHDGISLFNQSSQLIVRVKNANDERIYENFPVKTSWRNIYEGGGKMKQIHSYKTQYFQSFTEGSDSISGTLEPVYERIPVAERSNFHIKRPRTIIEKDGLTYQYEYNDSVSEVLKKYPDDSFEIYDYDQYQNRTLEIDRLGRATRMSYDAKGNLIKKEVGLQYNGLENPVSQSLVYFGLDESSGTQVSGTGAYTAQLTGNCTLNHPGATVDTGTSVYLDGQTAGITMSNDGSLDMENMSLSLWFQPDWDAGSVTYHPMLAGLKDATSTRMSVHVSKNLDSIKLYNGSSVTTYPVTITKGDWYHLSVSWADGVETVYLDNLHLGSKAHAFNGLYNLDFHIGFNGGTKFFKGALDEIRIFSSVISPLSELHSTADYAEYDYEYYPDSHDNRGRLRYEFDALGNRTEYLYNIDQYLVQINEPDDSGSGYHPKSIFTYDSDGNLSTSTDAEDRTTSFEYDDRNRIEKITYNDTSTELYFYGIAVNDANLLVKKKDRNGNTTKMTYDNSGRIIETITAYSVMNEDGSSETINLASVQSVRTCTYLDGTNYISECVENGEKTLIDYDYRFRVASQTTFADADSALVNTNTYEDNLLFSNTDPYGRSTYYLYRDSDSALIRTVTATVPSFTLDDFAAVEALVRDSGVNADYLITDYELDDEGQQIALVDARGIRQETDYDTRGRTTFWVKDAGGLDQTTQTIYDANSNVVEVRNPRYFSELINDCTTMIYSRRNLLESRTVAAGSTVAATEYFTYYDDGRAQTHTDFRGNTSTTVWHQCCGRLQASVDQAGHKQISNNDFYGNVTHTAVVDATGTISNYHELPDTQTLQEVTIEYDQRHRPVARTVWLQPLGLVDPNNVPIATDPLQGLTSRMSYFDEIDGHPELAPLLTELNADGISFDSNNDGSATVTINPEGEVSISLQDGAGRTVASGMYDKDDWALGVYTLVTWQTVTHDTVVNDLLETKSISALGFENKVQTDGAGRRLYVIDAENNTSSFTYDANSNLISSKDPNLVGMELCEYDNLNRQISCTDTGGDTTSALYDLNDSIVSRTDAKLKTELCEYDERNRLDNCTDRNDGTTSYTYDANSNVLSITDANNHTTGYLYDVRNLQTQVTYADSGVTLCTYDALGRKDVYTDQLGDTVEYTYDLAGRMTQRDYYLGGTTPESSDTFTYDDASRILTANKGRYSNTITITYDSIGRQKTEKVSVGGNDYTITNEDFDDDSRLLETTYSAGNKVYTGWTDRNQLKTVDFNANNIITSSYDPGMREDLRTFGNGLETTMTYNLDNTRDAISVAGHADISFTYDYDENKNVTEETSIGSAMAGYSWTAGFDDIDRVTSWNRSNADNQSWTLDKIGNWNNTLGSLAGNTFNETRSHNSVHELITKGSSPLTYDDKGNMTADANANNLVWDIDDHLQSFNTVTFTYDALGRRLEKKTSTGNTLYISNGQRVIEEYESVGGQPYSLARSYTHASYIDDIVAKIENITGTLAAQYYHCDRQFNVRGISDDSASPVIVETYAYSPYGQHTLVTSTATTNNSYGYTGRYLDSETDLWYFRARYFNDEIGRFISRDSLGYVDGMSLYQGYFSQHMALDPTGNAWGWWDWCKCAAGFAVSGPSVLWDVVRGLRDLAKLAGEFAKNIKGLAQDIKNFAYKAARSPKQTAKDLINGFKEIIGVIKGVGIMDILGVLSPSLATLVTDWSQLDKAPYDKCKLMGKAIGELVILVAGIVFTGGTSFVAQLGAKAATAGRRLAKFLSAITRTKFITKYCPTIRKVIGNKIPDALEIICFVAGTAVTVYAADGAIEYKNIEDIQVGDRVVTQAYSEQDSSTKVDEETWRKLTLATDIRCSDGTIDPIRIETIVSPDWVKDKKVGDWVHPPLDLYEMGLPEGILVQIVKNEKCPKISTAKGKVVLTTVNHLNNTVVDLTLKNTAGQVQIVRPTALHKFFSETRDTWVSAADLDHGEEIRCIGENYFVQSRKAVAGIHTVYNITVEDQHVYHVTESNLLVHNNNCGQKGGMKAAAGNNLKKMGLDKVDLKGKSYNSGRKALENSGFKHTGTSKTGRQTFENKDGIKVHYDSGKALAPGQKNHWHIQDKGGQKYDMQGRPVDSSSRAGHIPGA